MGGYQAQNRQAWDRLARQDSQFCRVATDEECARPLSCLDSRGWLPSSVEGWDVLCLASGGGWQAILYAAAGAQVTVVDLSPAMLELDQREADRRRLSVRTVQASMDDLAVLSDATFDLVHQPVSTCYVPDIATVYSEIGRVLRNGGLYISQHKTPTSLQISQRSRQGYVIGLEYYQQGELPVTPDTSYRESGATEYLHRWEHLVGELCRSGFVVEDLLEPLRADYSAPVGHYRHRGRFVAPYVRIKARRITRPDSPDAAQGIWLPSGGPSSPHRNPQKLPDR
ncbi:MAG: class I SAM-dependent methyltransferase [Planctomycetaceae bacterium]